MLKAIVKILDNKDFRVPAKVTFMEYKQQKLKLKLKIKEEEGKSDII